MRAFLRLLLLFATSWVSLTTFKKLDITLLQRRQDKTRLEIYFSRPTATYSSRERIKIN